MLMLMRVCVCVCVCVDVLLSLQVLLTTDVAARGLDIPNVNWVVQMDCPESVDTYIHRAVGLSDGQTGRWADTLTPSLLHSFTPSHLHTFTLTYS